MALHNYNYISCKHGILDPIFCAVLLQRVYFHPFP